MKKISDKISHTLLILSLMSFLLFIALPAYAQVINLGAPVKKGSDKNNIIELSAEWGLEYSDNVYRLSDAQIYWMKTNDDADKASGRFKDMDAVSDFISRPRIGLRVDSDGLFDGKFRLTSWVRYYAYARNPKRGYPEARLRISNTIGEYGVLSVEENFIRGFFNRNYLTGVNDINLNGNISRDERTYSRATYDEYEGIIAYEREIINDNDKSISGLDIRPFLGHRSRIYNSIFDNRDQDITFGGLGVNIEFISIFDLEISYQYENVDTSADEELVLFDETGSYTDVNDDRDIKRNAALITNVDRNCNRHTIEINPSVRITKDFLFFLGYQRRLTSYESSNRLDMDHYNNKPSRERIKSGMSYDFSKAFSAEVEYSQTSDHDDEDGDYVQQNIFFTLIYNFI